MAGQVPPEIVVIGSLHMDIVATADRLPVRGETLPGTSLAFHPGGKAGNQAVAAHRAGGRSALLACVGQDDFGARLIAAIREQGVDVRHIAVDPSVGTGASPVFVGEGGDYCSMIVPGSSMTITPEFVRAHGNALAHANIVIGQLEIAPEGTAEALRIGKSRGAITVLNAAPAPASGGLPAALRGVIDVLVANAVEAAMLLDSGTALTIPASDATSLLAEKYDIAQVIVTLGADGVVGYAEGQVTHLDAHPVTVADTLGAGDAFIGAFAVAIAEGRAFSEALTRANAAGAIATTRPGGIDGLPTAAMIDAMLAAGGTV